MAKRTTPNAPCPCGSGRTLGACCGRYLDGREIPPTPEALMRSRYTAFVLGREDWLLATWAPETRPERIFEEGEERLKWFSLEVGETGVEGDRGVVCFTARARSRTGAVRLVERSRFRREPDGRWLYVDGDLS